MLVIDRFIFDNDLPASPVDDKFMDGDAAGYIPLTGCAVFCKRVNEIKLGKKTRLLTLAICSKTMECLILSNIF